MMKYINPFIILLWVVLVAGCIKENIGSEKVMQKCGMIKEAEHVHCVWHEGRLKNRVEYRLLKTEWLAQRQTDK